MNKSCANLLIILQKEAHEPSTGFNKASNIISMYTILYIYMYTPMSIAYQLVDTCAICIHAAYHIET